MIKFLKNLVFTVTRRVEFPIRLFLVCALLTASFTLRVQAQFYDSEDEVRFYISDKAIADPGFTYTALIFNFNGDKAAKCCPHSTNYNMILEDENYWEKEIYGPNKEIINYYSGFSTPYKVVYGRPSQYTNRVNKWVFTEDGKHLEEVPAGNQEGFNMNNRYTRVSKEKFIELILAYENKKNRSWR